MAQRKKSRRPKSFLERTSLSTLAVGVVLALVAYIALHGAATRGLPDAAADVRTMVEVGQFVVPMLVIVAAVFLGTRRAREASKSAKSASSASPAKPVAVTRTPQAIDRLAEQEFEALLTSAFELQGYHQVGDAGGGLHGKVDLVLRRERETYLVFYKQWREHKTNVDAVQRLHKNMNARGVGGGFVVSSGRFGRDAVAFAASSNIRLIDGPALQGMIERAKAARSRSTADTA